MTAMEISDANEAGTGNTRKEDESNNQANETSLKTSEICSFDVRNLLAMNDHQVNISSLYQPSKATGDEKNDNDNEEEKICIPSASGKNEINESHLLQKASEGCQQLIGELWSLPSERRSDVVGPLAVLPSSFSVFTPRALPPPKPMGETKWEKFAKERGIDKKKRDRKVFDEATQTWKFRHGYQKANAADAEWPIMEVKKNDDPMDDPWQKARDEKKIRVNKNLESQMLNEERMGALPKGTTRRVMKQRTAKFEYGRERGMNDVVPAGVPVDLKGGMKRGKDLTHMALVASQRSTASLGKFDGMREGEPERKKAIKKRKFDSVVDKTGVVNESEKGMKVLQRVINGGKEKDRDIKKGHLAKGETAYDYEFNDGLGPSTFKKKKGRAGVGKMKKMTKKRIK